MEELIATLIRQAFVSQNERIEEIKEELKSVKEENVLLTQKVKNLVELNGLMDKSISECRELIKNYVAKDDEVDLMEEYKFGE